jgi:hypothetical protein
LIAITENKIFTRRQRLEETKHLSYNEEMISLQELSIQNEEDFFPCPILSSDFKIGTHYIRYDDIELRRLLLWKYSTIISGELNIDGTIFHSEGAPNKQILEFEIKIKKCCSLISYFLADESSAAARKMKKNITLDLKSLKNSFRLKEYSKTEKITLVNRVIEKHHPCYSIFDYENQTNAKNKHEIEAALAKEPGIYFIFLAQMNSPRTAEVKNFRYWMHKTRQALFPTRKIAFFRLAFLLFSFLTVYLAGYAGYREKTHFMTTPFFYICSLGAFSFAFFFSFEIAKHEKEAIAEYSKKLLFAFSDVAFSVLGILCASFALFLLEEKTIQPIPFVSALFSSIALFFLPLLFCRSFAGKQSAKMEAK